MAPGDPSKGARACVLTAEGRGAIAVLRIWGPEALQVAAAVFQPAVGPPLSRSPVGTIRYGRAGLGVGDEVVAVVTAVDPPEVEIQGHGGQAALASILSALEAAGAEHRGPSAWIRAVSDSVIASEARVDLARAPTQRAAEILLEQSQGALDRELADLAQEIESGSPEVEGHVAALIDRARVGLRLADGWRLAIVGRPNVGKSRLLNALAGYDRAIVDPTPGTTRDVIAFATAIDGWPVELRDTAGRREANDPIEQAGIGAGRAASRQADLTILVLDGSEPLQPADHAMLAERHDALVVVNKADLPQAWAAGTVGGLPISAATGEGLEPLGAEIARRLVPVVLPPAGGVPFRARHLRLLEQLRDSLASADGSAAAIARVLRSGGSV